jgi:hypothetical protein
MGGKDFLVKNKNYVPKKQTNCIFILSLSVFFFFFFKKDFLSKISWKIEKFIDPLYSFFAPHRCAERKRSLGIAPAEGFAPHLLLLRRGLPRR